MLVGFSLDSENVKLLGRYLYLEIVFWGWGMVEFYNSIV